MTQKLNIELVLARNKQVTAIATFLENDSFYLHSSVNPTEEGNYWAKKIEVAEHTMFLILGVGLGYHIEALLKKIPKSSQVLALHTAYETKLLQYLAKNGNIKWLHDSNFNLLQLTNIHDMGVLIGDLMLNKRIKRICLCRHYPTMKLGCGQYREVETQLVGNIEQSMGINFNVSITTGYYFFKNYWLNFPFITRGSGIAKFKNSFKKYPVIVVAAGPSLDKNVHLLKECKERAIIIAAGTAISALRYYDITPDFIVFADALPGNYDVLKDYLSTGATLISSTTAQNEVLQNYDGPMFFFENGIDYSGGASSFFKDISSLNQTVSVATGAVDFAVKSGAKTIILLGQDLAFEDQVDYAKGTKAGGYDLEKRIVVPGYKEEWVETVPTFKVVIDYYNQYVIEKGDVRFINATEGGALISGMEQRSLRSVIDSLLPKHVIDKNFIKEKCRFERQNQKEILNFLKKMNLEVCELKNRVKDFFDAEKYLSDESTECLIETDLLKETNDKIEKFYLDITSLKGYHYIEILMRSRLELLYFQKQDGMQGEIEYLFYRNLVLGLRELIDQFSIWIEASIDAIQERNRGV